MSLSFTAMIPIFMVFILYFLGMPIVYSLFGSTFFYFLFIDTTSQPFLILQKVMNSTQSFSMLAIPFFIMSGSVMNFGGISDKLMDFCECVTGHMKGGLAQVNVLLSMLMGGCSGSANADCAMQSKMLVPEMEKRGYSKSFSAAITAASSAATPVIPPGVNLIVFTHDRPGVPGPHLRRGLCPRHPDGDFDDDHRGHHRQEAELPHHSG